MIAPENGVVGGGERFDAVAAEDLVAFGIVTIGTAGEGADFVDEARACCWIEERAGDRTGGVGVGLDFQFEIWR